MMRARQTTIALLVILMAVAFTSACSKKEEASPKLTAEVASPDPALPEVSQPYDDFEPMLREGYKKNGDADREIGYIPMKDGVRLAYVLYRPKREGKYPTLVEYSPYMSDGMSYPTAKPYLDHGYAVVGVNIRGTGCSEGTFTLWNPIQGVDGAELIEWTGTQPWSTGAVGMIGVSYPGHTQIMTAAHHPAHLKAIAPGGLTASSYREVWMAGGIFNVGITGWWAVDAQPAISRIPAEVRIKEWGDKECEGIRAKQKPNPAFYEVQQHPLYDDWWKARDLENIIDKVDVPTLIMHGWQDQETASSGPQNLFKHLKVANKKMIFQSGGHEVPERDINREQAIRWMDHWLKGEDNGIEKEPPVTILWEVKDQGGLFDAKAQANWKSTYSAWPVPGLQRLTLYLTQDGKLNREKAGASQDDGVRSYVYPIGTELIGTNRQFAVKPRSAGILIYRTEPMEDDATILGLPQLTLYFSSEQKDTDFKVALHDIDADGNTLFLQRGLLRASLRTVDTAKSNDDEIIQSFHKPEYLVPGRIYEMKLSFYALGHVLRKGHRLELSIMAPNALQDSDWSQLPVALPSLNKVYQSTKYPSSLTLPIVPGEKAQAAPPACGSLQFQPCRLAPKPGS